MTDVLLTLAGFAILIGLILLPVYQAFQRGRWIWLFAIIVLAPIAGVFWLLTQRALDRAGLSVPDRAL